MDGNSGAGGGNDMFDESVVGSVVGKARAAPPMAMPRASAAAAQRPLWFRMILIPQSGRMVCRTEQRARQARHRPSANESLQK
jgi:hypothetical protein